MEVWRGAIGCDSVLFWWLRLELIEGVRGARKTGFDTKPLNSAMYFIFRHALA